MLQNFPAALGMNLRKNDARMVAGPFRFFWTAGSGLLVHSPQPYLGSTEIVAINTIYFSNHFCLHALQIRPATVLKLLVV